MRACDNNISDGSPSLASVIPPGVTKVRVGVVLRCMYSEQNKDRMRGESKILPSRVHFSIEPCMLTSLFVGIAINSDFAWGRSRPISAISRVIVSFPVASLAQLLLIERTF